MEEETKGSYKVSSTEAWNDKREINASDGIDLDEEGSTGDDESEDGEDDDDDDGGSESSDSASTPRKKRQRASSKKVKKSKKAKKEKKESKAKDNKKKKDRRKRSSASSRGSPKKEDLEEEKRTEATSRKLVGPSYKLLLPASKAIDNATEVMQQLLRVQAKVEACEGKLEKVQGAKAEACFGRRVWGLTCRLPWGRDTLECSTELRSLKTIHGYATKLSDFHDQLADLKASHAGTNKFFCEKPLVSTTLLFCIRPKPMKPVITDVSCGHF